MEAPPPLLDESSDEEASSVESSDRIPGWLSESDSEMAESESSDEPPPAWWLLQGAQLFEHETCTTGENSGVGGDCCSCGEVRPPDRAQVEEAARFVLGRMKQTQSGLQAWDHADFVRMANQSVLFQPSWKPLVVLQEAQANAFTFGGQETSLINMWHGRRPGGIVNCVNDLGTLRQLRGSRLVPFRLGCNCLYDHPALTRMFRSNASDAGFPRLMHVNASMSGPVKFLAKDGLRPYCVAFAGAEFVVLERIRIRKEDYWVVLIELREFTLDPDQHEDCGSATPGLEGLPDMHARLGTHETIGVVPVTTEGMATLQKGQAPTDIDRFKAWSMDPRYHAVSHHVWGLDDYRIFLFMHRLLLTFAPLFITLIRRCSIFMWCAYILAAREKAASELEENCRRRMEAELTGHGECSSLMERKEDQATATEKLCASSGSMSLLSSKTPPPTAPGEGAGSSPGNSGFFSSSLSSSSSPSPSPPPPPPPPSPELERRHSLVNGKDNSEHGSSSSSSISIRGTGDISGTTSGRDNDSDGDSDRGSDSGSDSDIKGSGIVLGIAAVGPSTATTEPEQMESGESPEPGHDSVGAAPGDALAPATPAAAAATALESTTTTSVVGCGGGSGNMLSGGDGGDPVKTADYVVTASAAASTNGTAIATTAVTAPAATVTSAVTPPPRQRQVQPYWISGGSSAGGSSGGVGDGAGLPRDNASSESASADDPTDDGSPALTQQFNCDSSSSSGGRGGGGGGGRSLAGVVEERAANNPPPDLEGGTAEGLKPAVSTAAAVAEGSVHGEFVVHGFRIPAATGKRAEAAAVGLPKSPPYLAGAEAETRAMSIPGAVLVNGDGGKEGEGCCWQAGRGAVALKTGRSARSGRVPLPYLGDAPIRRVASF